MMTAASYLLQVLAFCFGAGAAAAFIAELKNSRRAWILVANILLVAINAAIFILQFNIRALTP